MPTKKKQVRNKKKRSIQPEILADEDFEGDTNRTYQGEHLMPLNEESGIINIFREALSSSKSNSLQHHGRDISPEDSEGIEYPLKELKPKIGS